MNDKIKINLQMAGASYPLTINREDEEMVREAAKQVDIRLNAYREHYQNVSLERIIAMVAYQVGKREKFAHCTKVCPSSKQAFMQCFFIYILKTN